MSTTMLIVRIGLGCVIGGAAGAALGYFGKCTSGTCPLTANPGRGAAVGAALGILLALSMPGKDQETVETDRDAGSQPVATVEESTEETEPPAAEVTGEATEEAIIHIEGAEDFQKRVLEGSKLYVVDFYADWCPPCKMLSPVLEKVAASKGDVLTVAKIDVDESENRELAVRYQVQGIPRLLLVRDGDVVSSKTGFMPEDELLSWISQNEK